MKLTPNYTACCFGTMVKKESLEKDGEARRKHCHGFVLSRRPAVYKRDAIFPSGWVRRSVRPYLRKANNAITKLLYSCVVLCTQTMSEEAGRSLLRCAEGSNITSFLCLVRIYLINSRMNGAQFQVLNENRWLNWRLLFTKFNDGEKDT